MVDAFGRPAAVIAVTLALGLACQSPPAPRFADVTATEAAADPKSQPLVTTTPPGRTTARPVAAASSAVHAVAPPEPPAPRHPFHDPIPPAWLAKTASAMKYANMAPWQCRDELDRRQLPIARDRGPAPGIAMPVRFTDQIAGVRYFSPGRKSPYGKLDCRLALTLVDFAELIAPLGVVQVRIDNFYRPRARLPSRRGKSQHAYGLAADVVSFTFADGHTLDVERDFHGSRGAPPCGPEADVGEGGAAAVELRNLTCTVARAGLFHHLLTPNYDAAHENHFHLDIKRGEKRWAIH